MENVFYHLYVCGSKQCLESNNPQNGSWHQRGINLATDKPRTDVKCPGCKGNMIIARNGDVSTYRTDHDGNLIAMGGDAIVQLAPGQPDQTAEIEKENA